MKTLTLAVVVLAAALCAACHEQKQDPRPDYDSVRQHSQGSHGSLDAEKPGE